jgi:hypothetical protein
MPAHYFLGSQLLATAPLSAPWQDSDGPNTLSSAYLCPTCGTLWAQISIDGARWTPITRSCPLHGGGQFSHPWQRDLSLYPEAVLQHDARIALKELP